MNHTRLIIAREYITKVKNKSFLLMTLLTPALIGGLIFLISFLTSVNNDSLKNITVVDNSGIFENSLSSSETIQFYFLEDLDEDEAKLISQDRSDDALIFIPYVMDSKNIDYVELSKSIKLISEDSPSLTLISNIENQLEKILTDLNFEKVGLDLTLIKNSNIYINLFQESFEGEETTKVDGLIKVLFGLVLGGLLYMFIFIYGSMIMRSVIEEKSNRIVEIIISSVKPTQLMMGKIIGTSLAGLTQVLIWNFLGFIILNIVGSSMGVSTENMSNLDSLQAADVEPFAIEILSAVFNLPIFNILISFVLYFLFGYLLYASIFAAIGAAVDNETDSQQFMLPISIPLIVALYVGMLTVPEDPGGTISTFFSHFPLTSPVVMMMRIPYGVPIYEQIISLSILVVTFFATVWFAAKIYRVGILMYGQKTSYKDLYKWLKY